MFKYEEIIKYLLEGTQFRTKGQELQCCCPFHEEKHESFSINMETGAFNCFACEEKGSITDFVAKRLNISTTEAWKEIKEALGESENSTTETSNTKYLPYTMEDYAREKHFDIEYLKSLDIKTADNGKSVEIPYYDTDKNCIGVRHRNAPTSEVRFWWGKGSKANLYGLWALNNFKNDYVILVEGESDCHTMWQYDVQVIRMSWC